MQCDRALYRGFDSRLHASLAGTIPTEGPTPIGLALLRDKPVVAYQDHLIAYSSPTTFQILRTPGSVVGLLSTGNSLRLVITDGVLSIGEKAFEKVALPAGIGGARLAQGGTRSALIALQQDGKVEFTGLTEGGVWLPMFAIEGKLHQMSWTTAGLATVVGESLYTLAANTTQMEVTAKDPSLQEAKALCMVGRSAAVVVYPNTTVLYAHGFRTIIAAITGECAWDGKALFLTDARHGAVWKVDGLNAMETPASTVAFLQQLASESRGTGADADRAFAELMRLIGSTQAAKLTNKPDPCAIR